MWKFGATRGRVVQDYPRDLHWDSVKVCCKALHIQPCSQPVRSESLAYLMLALFVGFLGPGRGSNFDCVTATRDPGAPQRPPQRVELGSFGLEYDFHGQLADKVSKEVMIIIFEFPGPRKHSNLGRVCSNPLWEASQAPQIFFGAVQRSSQLGL